MDVTDQNRSMLRPEKRIRRWIVQVFCLVLVSSIVQAHIDWRQLNPSCKDEDLITFTRHVCNEWMYSKKLHMDFEDSVLAAASPKKSSLATPIAHAGGGGGGGGGGGDNGRCSSLFSSAAPSSSSSSSGAGATATSPAASPAPSYPFVFNVNGEEHVMTPAGDGGNHRCGLSGCGGAKKKHSDAGGGTRKKRRAGKALRRQEQGRKTLFVCHKCNEYLCMPGVGRVPSDAQNCAKLHHKNLTSDDKK